MASRIAEQEDTHLFSADLGYPPLSNEVTPDPSPCCSQDRRKKKKKAGHITWRCSRLRSSETMVRRKRRPSSSTNDGHVKGKAMAKDAHDGKESGEDEDIGLSVPLELGAATDSLREEINLIMSSQQMATGGSSFRQDGCSSRSSQICLLESANGGHECGNISRKHGHRQGLSYEYQPKIFEEIVSHEMIVKALSNAVQKKRISSMYLFHGPGGTGKTSAARLFGMALNCESAALPSKKPCWSCVGCSRSLYTAEMCSGGGKSSSLFEKIRTFLCNPTSFEQTLFSSGFKVFIIDEICSQLTPHSWGELLDMITEEQDKGCGSVVFIITAEDTNMIPRAVSSRCQNFSFSKLKDIDVRQKLTRIAGQEGINIRKDALKLIARKAEGNLREAENLLDQLALLELRITASMVQQLVGLAPYERLIRLLEAALSGSSTEAVRYARDLIGCGIGPRALVSQLASLVTEVLGGPSSSSSSPTELQDQSPIQDHSRLRSKQQPEKLTRALKILIETDKALIMSPPCNDTTWVTGALLQIASDSSSQHITTEVTMMPDATNPAVVADDKSKAVNRTSKPPDHIESSKAGHHHQSTTSTAQHPCYSTHDLNKTIDMEQVWKGILERIQNRGMEEFLQSQAKLVSLTVSRANAIVHLMFKHSEDIPEDSILNALNDALGCPVTMNISREPRQLQLCFSHNGIETPEPIHSEKAPAVFRPSKSLDGGLLLRRSVSQRSAPTVESMRPSAFQNSGQMLGYRTENRDSMPQNQENSSHPAQLTNGGRESNFTDPQMHNSRKDQSLDTTSIARRKHRVLSASSIAQTDASIEPYSQDLLFEEANTNKQQGARNSNLHKDFVKSKQTSHNMNYRGMNRSWSCRERFCRGETTVTENKMHLATNRHVEKSAYPCKDSTVMNSITNKAQSDLRKTVPTSSCSSLKLSG